MTIPGGIPAGRDPDGGRRKITEVSVILDNRYVSFNRWIGSEDTDWKLRNLCEEKGTSTGLYLIDAFQKNTCLPADYGRV